MKSFLLIGQSNMAGRGYLNDAPAIYNENIEVLRNGRWQMMAEPLHNDREVAGIGPAASFAAAWAQDHQAEKLGLIPCAEGGSSIDEWAEDQVLARHALSEAKFAMETSELIGILWHQGENDSLNGQYKDYAEKLKAVFGHFRQALSLPELPIIVGELPDFLGKSGFGQSAIEFKEINREIQTVVKGTKNSYLVSAENLASNPDGIHINAESQRQFGIRYYEAFKKRINVAHALGNEDEQLSRIYGRETTTNEKIYLLSRDFALGKLDYQTFMKKFAEITK
ncbi:sialate O-acetylesterase [Candidatus Enterococcus murrayae]|uniref:Sialate O-acetylesterase n=1 Tax=Candidatus Enterococcus murrayae TaxID=2815321 RepID=A0ABS3HF84_9ENTE|nr:sialate O-acetylesterase [Enterococcus sp. MJM16]MBO0452109.1 sialate O-acetylesterase [Enterococcus sp. MJM16]